MLRFRINTKDVHLPMSYGDCYSLVMTAAVNAGQHKAVSRSRFEVQGSVSKKTPGSAYTLIHAIRYENGRFYVPSYMRYYTLRGKNPSFRSLLVRQVDQCNSGT